MKWIKMGKGAAAGIVIALIAGVAIGYFVIPMIFAANGDQTNFCVQNDADIDVNSQLVTVIPNLNITFSTHTGDSVLFTYTCHYTLVLIDPGDVAGTYIDLVIDGVADPASWIQVSGNYSADEAYHSTIILRYLKTLPSGSHNVSVRFSRYTIASSQLARQNVLCVQII